MDKELVNKLFDNKDIAKIFETYNDVICSDCDEKCDIAKKIVHFYRDIESVSPAIFMFKLQLLKTIKSKISKSESEQSEQFSETDFNKVKDIIDSEDFSKMFSNNKELLIEIKKYINSKQKDVNTSK